VTRLVLVLVSLVVGGLLALGASTIVSEVLVSSNGPANQQLYNYGNR